VHIKNAEKQIKSRPTTCTMVVELSSIYTDGLKNTTATSTKYYCNIFYLRLQHLNNTTATCVKK
jgi:hypothetical protein